MRLGQWVGPSSTREIDDPAFFLLGGISTVNWENFSRLALSSVRLSFCLLRGDVGVAVEEGRHVCGAQGEMDHFDADRPEAQFWWPSPIHAYCIV